MWIKSKIGLLLKYRQAIDKLSPETVKLLGSAK